MRTVWRLLREYVRPHAGALAVRVVIAACVAATPYAFSFLGKWLVDEALQVTGPPKTAPPAAAATGAPAAPVAVEWKAKTTEQKLHLLGVFLAVSLGIHVAVTALSAVSELLNSRTVQKMTFEMRSAVHEKFSGMEMGQFGREQVGQMMIRTLDDTGTIPGNLTNLVINFATQVAMLVLGLVLLLRLNVPMTLLALVALPFYAVSCAVFLPRLRRNAEEQRNRWAVFNGYIIERLANVLTIKNYAQEQQELGRFGELLEANRAVAGRNHRLNLFFGTLTTLITAGGTLAVLAFGFVNIQARRMQLGEVLAFYQVTAQLFVPISALVGMATVAQTLQVFGGRVYEILDAEQTIRNAPDAVAPEDIRGEIEFDNVCLRYEEGAPFTVQDLSFHVPPGAVACLVGPAGCGKSTPLALLTRLYDPTSGVIRLDGLDIRRYRLRRLRRAVGNILQGCQVFSGSFAENLRFGAPHLPMEDVEQAARLVGLHDFIAAQPGGYEARIGRGGLTLGPEELARLAVARALVPRPAVLTIDDTFAAIEEDLERQLRAAIRTALAGKTVLIATSRLSLCQDADLVIVLQRGRVVQSGTHEQLLAAAGVYRRMYMRQMGLEDVPG